MFGRNKQTALWVFCAALISIFSTYLTSPKFARGSVLSDAANALLPGQFAVITPTNISAIIDMNNVYADSAVWDAVGHKFYFVGTGAHGSLTQNIIYDEATNAWIVGTIPPAPPQNAGTGLPWVIGHADDNNTFDPIHRKFYYRIDNSIMTQRDPGGPQDFVFDVATQTWSYMPINTARRAITDAGACCDAQAYFPERGGVVEIDAAGLTWFFSDATQAWSQLTTPSGWSGGTWTWAQYSGTAHILLFGNSTQIYKMDSAGALTQLSNPGNLSLYGSGWGGNVIDDPVTGKFIFYLTDGNANYTLRVYDPITQTWGSTVNLPTFTNPTLHAGLVGAISSASVSNYGITITAVCGDVVGSCDGRLLLYKNSTGSVTSPSDTSAPSTPTNLSASTISSSQINLSWTASTDNVGVTGYKIYRNGTQIVTASGTSYQNTGLSPSTTYSYTVAAYDAAGNTSTQSASASATTQASSFDFSLSNGGNQSVTQGQSISNNITATLVSGTAQAVSFSTSGIPTGATYSYSPTSCNLTCSTTLNISTTASTPAGSYLISVTASGGGVTKTTSFTLTVTSTTSTSADADFAARCAAAGVAYCNGLNTMGTFGNADLVRRDADANNYNILPRADGQYRASIDPNVKMSGAGSLQFKLDAGYAAADIAGQFLPHTHLPFAFGENTDWYVQYAVRFSPEYFSNGQYWQVGSKISIFLQNEASCASKELTTNHWNYNARWAAGYKDCGGQGWRTDLDGSTFRSVQQSTPYLFQQGDYACAYPGTGNCWEFPTDTWITLYYKIHNGTWGSVGHTLEAWYSINGQPYKKWLNITANWKVDCNSDVTCPNEVFNNINFTPYMTALSTAAPVDAFVWYDELLVSSQPIAAPNSSAGTVTTPPASPTNLILK